MSVSDRIQESTKRVEARTREALDSLQKTLDNAERQNLRVVELQGPCKHLLAALGRLGSGQILMDQGEVAVAQALVQDVSNGVSEDLGFGRQADAEMVQTVTQTITLAERGTSAALQSFVSEAQIHANAAL